MTIASQRLTLDEFLAKYEHDPILEYAQGVVTERLSASWDHGALQSLVGQAINAVAWPRKLGIALSSLRITDQDTDVSRIPDLSVFAWDRIERDPVARRRGAFSAPDVAIEILSPGQTRSSQIKGCREFVASGSRAALLFEPDARTITAVRPNTVERSYGESDHLDLGDIIPGLTLDIGALFADMSFE
ncbi:MAG: Uma2 family endonuclease [Chloroflexota bacterium]